MSLLLINSNALHIPLPDNSVQCVVTSPPYYGLRDYGTAKWEGGDPSCNHKVGRFLYPVSDKQFSNSGSAGHQAKDVCPKCGAIRKDDQIGLEQSPEEYVKKIVAVFREVWRVLRDDGTVWLNMGDSYAGSGCHKESHKNPGLNHSGKKGVRGNPVTEGYKAKDLIGMPWKLAFALQADGWYLRSDIIWAKPNPMPESVSDRPTKSHEYLFLLSKNQHYFYDANAILEHAEWTRNNSNKSRRGHTTKDDLPNPQHHGNNMTGNFLIIGRTGDGHKGAFDENGKIRATINGGIPARNKRSVWTIPTAPYRGAHFATFPPALVEPCIKAGTSEKGCCPKCGKAWVRVSEHSYQKNRLSAGNDLRSKNADRLSDARGHGGWQGNNLLRVNDTLGWRPDCYCYPRFEEWKEYPQKERNESEEHYQKRIEPIRIKHLELVEFWKSFETVPCIVFDPFVGSGTTLLVARQLGRHGVGCDLSFVYLHDQARKRLELDKLAEWVK